MTTDQPLSLTEAQRLAPNTDTILLRATRPADLETPIGAFLRLDDGGKVSRVISGAPGLTNLASPLALVEDPVKGNLYVTEFDTQRIVLLRPQ